MLCTNELEKSVPSHKPEIHKIGSARTIQTAVLVCEYLRRVCANPQSSIHGDCIRYRFTEPSSTNGFWSADILVDVYGAYSKEQDDALSNMVTVCRAFVAGRGEIWA